MEVPEKKVYVYKLVDYTFSLESILIKSDGIEKKKKNV